jgi:hypothetical protein
MDADSRQFMRELLLRHEQATRSMIARLDTGTEALRDLTVEMKADHAEHRAEMRAQREALFRAFDRLDEGGSAAGA